MKLFSFKKKNKERNIRFVLGAALFNIKEKEKKSSLKKGEFLKKMAVFSRGVYNNNFKKEKRRPSVTENLYVRPWIKANN